MESAERVALCSRSQARRREEPATEAALVVAVGRPCSAVLRARFRNEGTDLAGRRGKGTLMVVCLMTRHGDNQVLEIVGHTVLLERRGQQCEHSRRRRRCILIYMRMHRVKSCYSGVCKLALFLRGESANIARACPSSCRFPMWKRPIKAAARRHILSVDFRRTSGNLQHASRNSKIRKPWFGCGRSLGM